MENDTEDEELDIEDLNSNDSESNGSSRSLKRKVKNKVKEAGKNVVDSFKEGIKQLWNKLPLKIKLICIAIGVAVLIIALFLIVILEYTTNESYNTIIGYMETIESPEAKSAYESTGSLLFLTDDDIKNISENYLASIKDKADVSYDIFSKEYKFANSNNSGVPLQNGAIGFGEKKTIYEHILNAERYNFNRIVWKEYDRDSTTAKDVEMVVDEKTRLQYPKDDKRDLKYFTEFIYPYLQSWIIPFSMMAGISTTAQASVRASDFAYEIINSAYSKIEMEKRNLESYNLHKQYKEYTERVATSTATKNCDTTENGETVCSCSSSKSFEEYYVKEDEIVVGEEILYNTVYNFNSIQAFNQAIEESISVVKYDTNNRYDRRNVVESEYEYSEPSKKAVCPDGPGTNTVSYIASRKGKQYDITETWNDKLNTSSTTRKYTIEDIESNIGGKLSSAEKNYYNGLEENDEINRVDIMNASKDSYKEYIEAEAYSKNIGYTREKLQVSYRILQKYMGDYLEKISKNSAMMGLSLEALSSIDTNAEYFLPIQDSHLLIDDEYISPGVYGYAGHTGIDFPYYYAYANASNCSDYSDMSECPYIAGPPVYAVQDGILEAVAYSPYNQHYGNGTPCYTDDGQLIGGGLSGSYVRIRHTDSYGKTWYSAYWHLYPDHEQLKELSKKVGQPISAGTALGHMGNTGNSTGLHLHFEYAKILWRLGNGGTTLAIIRLAEKVNN